jgi:hypothetical protein
MPTPLGLLQFLCVDLGAAICDQLIGQAFTWRQVGEHATGSLYCHPAFGSRLLGFAGVSHGPKGTAGHIQLLVLASLVGHDPMIRIVCGGNLPSSVAAIY